MHSLYSGLVSYWNLQDQSGSRLDLTGTGNTLTNTNTVTTVDGIIGNASGFASASSQRLQIASNSSIQGGPKNYTFAAWVQLGSKPAADMQILSKYSATAGQAEYQLLWANATDSFVMRAYSATDVKAETPFNLTSVINTWYHVVGWVDSVNQGVWIDVNASGVNSIGMVGAPQAASAAVFAIGSLGATGTQYWNGKIAEVARWDRILTTQERVWLYNNGYGRTFPFDERFSRGIGRHMRSRRYASIFG